MKKGGSKSKGKKAGKGSKSETKEGKGSKSKGEGKAKKTPAAAAGGAPVASASDKIVAELLAQLKMAQQTAPKAAPKAGPKGKPPPVEEPEEPEEEPAEFEKDAHIIERGIVRLGNKKWSEVPAIGKPIENTRFICFKTPIDMALPTNPDYNMFTTEQLINDQMPSLGRTLGLVVDLTDTYKFYNPYDAFESKQIKHVKLFLPGVDCLPRPEKVLQFNEIVLKFIKDTEGSPDRNGEDVLVGVHCNQGVNMTCFMVCQFMITKMFRNQTRAIVAFETARGAAVSSDTVKSTLKSMEPFRAPEFAHLKRAPAPRKPDTGFAKEIKLT